MMTLNVDKQLLLIIAMLTMLGILMIYSATSVKCEKDARYGDSMYYLKKNLVRVAIAVAGLIAASQVDYRFMKKKAPLILMFGALLLITVMIPRLSLIHISEPTRPY